MRKIAEALTDATKIIGRLVSYVKFNKYFFSVITRMNLSPETLRTYKSVIDKLETLEHIDFDGPNHTIRLHSTLMHYLNTHIPNPGSRKVYVSAILNEIRSWPAEAKKPYIDLNASLRKTTAQTAISQTLKEARKTNMLAWHNVLALKKKALETLTPEDFLIYCLYTLAPPVRADYAEMPVVGYYGKTHKNDIKKNYCVMHDRNGYFIFNKYKTEKKYGQLKIPIPSELYTVIKERVNVGELLLPSVSSPSTLSKRVMTIFTKLSGKAMGIGLLRHSYITTYLSTVQRITDKADLAMRMMHSWVTQETYHIISSDEE